ncbi:hypothetical protein [Dokdonella soli]|uniref:Uncharacterized protein n=1 Tax=Dokdonella soli TaxID=529810 RepID=A0ABN1IJQ1_9GAMM
MSTFSEHAAPFGAYFSSLAQISGALVGLVFVALTFNIKSLGLRGRPELRDLARQTFADFLTVLVLSLTLLLPGLSADAAGYVLIALALVALLRVLRGLYGAVTRTADARARGQIVQRFLLSLMGNSGVLCTGVIALRGMVDSDALWSLLASSPMVLLISGSRSAWMLVVHSDD